METEHRKLLKILRLSERGAAQVVGVSHSTTRNVLLGQKGRIEFTEPTRKQVLTGIEREAERVSANIEKSLAKLRGEK